MEMQAGKFTVATTVDGGHGIDFYADRIVDRLIHVSESAPEPIKAQALVYRDSMRAIIRDGLLRSARSEKTTILAQMEKAGLKEAASLLRAMT